MRLSHAFIDRPIFATVLSVFITLIGLGAMFVLPVAQYPEIVPPTVQITTAYPGASAETVSRTVATPLEQQINGVENMLYMSSQSMGDGKLTITVTFRIGTDLNVAQMLTQNRVQDALPRLPDDVQRLGVQVSKKTPSILLAVHLYSPDSSRNTLYMSNYATLNIKDVLARLPGVGDVQIIGEREYAMRIWLDPDRVAARNMNASEVFAVLRAQNIQVAAGVLNQPPAPSSRANEVNVEALGRLETPEEFESIVLKSDADGRVTRLGDVGRVEIGAADYGATALTDRDPGMPLFIYAEPGANSLAVEHEVLSTIATLSKDFPPGLSDRCAFALPVMRITFSSFIRCFRKSGRTGNWRCSRGAKPMPAGSNIQTTRLSRLLTTRSVLLLPYSGRARKFRTCADLPCNGRSCTKRSRRALLNFTS
jgi:multidrug efflux pump subunit AcrB